MKNFIKKSAILASLLAVNYTYALPPQPAVCPDVNFIKVGSVSNVVLQVNNLWIAGRRNMTYNTTDHWTFLMTNIKAANSTEAYQKALLALTTLTFQLGPISGSEKWLCLYSSDSGNPAYTITTPIALRDALTYV